MTKGEQIYTQLYEGYQKNNKFPEKDTVDRNVVYAFMVERGIIVPEKDKMQGTMTIIKRWMSDTGRSDLIEKPDRVIYFCRAYEVKTNIVRIFNDAYDPKLLSPSRRTL